MQEKTDHISKYTICHKVLKLSLSQEKKKQKTKKQKNSIMTSNYKAKGFSNDFSLIASNNVYVGKEYIDIYQ